MKSLFTVMETNELIASGKCLLIAADERLLAQLKTGCWIGGTIPYFMGDEGGLVSNQVLQVTRLPDEARVKEIRNYSEANISDLPKYYPTNGFTKIIMPGFSAVLSKFAQEGSSWPGVFTRPLVGWVSGHHLENKENFVPKVINGQTGKFSTEDAVAIHFELPEKRFASVNIINLFEEGAGDIITFTKTDFEVSECKINGSTANFAEYLSNRRADVQIPLVADYFGAKINVSIRNIDLKNKVVQFFAPVFKGVEYRIGKPVVDYEAEFAARIAKNKLNPIFMCNCVLNFAYAKLENKRTGDMTGPMTFGEIAYMLLNQTLVYMTIEDSK